MSYRFIEKTFAGVIAPRNTLKKFTSNSMRMTLHLSAVPDGHIEWLLKSAERHWGGGTSTSGSDIHLDLWLALTHHFKLPYIAIARSTWAFYALHDSSPGIDRLELADTMAPFYKINGDNTLGGAVQEYGTFSEFTLYRVQRPSHMSSARMAGILMQANKNYSAADPQWHQLRQAIINRESIELINKVSPCPFNPSLTSSMSAPSAPPLSQILSEASSLLASEPQLVQGRSSP